jgi:pimeloyl-ACP methyl ester carboxylesterase
MASVQETRVPIDDGRFVADVLQSGDGGPLLYLHGEDGRAWDDFLAALARRHRVLAPCHPGYGESTGTDHLRDLPDLIYYYLDFLDALDLRDLPLVGHGLGGMIAAELAAVQPERFRRVVLIAPFGLWDPANPTLDFFAASRPDLAAAQFHDPSSPAAQAAATVPEEGEPYVRFMLERAKSLATAAKYLWPIPNRGLTRRLHRIKAPTLLVWGESDGIVPPRYGRDFLNRIKGSRLAVIKEAGHLPQIEQPEQLAELVLEFLGESTRDRPAHPG